MEEKPKSKGYVLRKLFFACLYLSTFTFGGGYVIVTLLKEKFVDHYHWIEEDEMLDLVAIAQSSPGAIAVNGAIIVGIHCRFESFSALCLQFHVFLRSFPVFSVFYQKNSTKEKFQIS